jgi:hypothetical protein
MNEPTARELARLSRGKCSKCEKTIEALGLCSAHYRAHLRKRPITTGRCNIQGCFRRAAKEGKCAEHSGLKAQMIADNDRVTDEANTCPT